MSLNEADYRDTLLAATLKAMARCGAGRVIAGDVTTPSMSYRQLFTRAMILRGKLAPLLSGQPYVAMLLPNALGALVTFFSLHMLGKVPCMLNFTAGEANMLHACRIARVKTILTSRVFVDKAKLEPLIRALSKDHAIVYLEDFRKQVSAGDKLKGAVAAMFPHLAFSTVLKETTPDDPAVVLYTSGSEGTPKGVVLSHANILVNVAQACTRFNFKQGDIVFNALPVFHSFGLTVGMLMPVLRGFKTFLYPSPAHYKQIPAMVRDTGSTIMLGTDTFYNGYTRYSEPHDFKKLWLAVAGAEKLREKTRLEWIERFGVDIMQGYGVTETSPAIAINTPDEHKPGTVGRPFPDIECKLEAVEGLTEGGRLVVKGPNVMLGYLKADQPGVIQPQGEWYDTGDIVTIDAQGFIAIQGRAKRFAKIAGEMVSLAAVEELPYLHNAEVAHAAIAIPDDRKGEQIVLYTEDKTLTRETLLALAQQRGVAELGLPRQVIHVEAIPRLGNGKIDYQALKNLTPAS